MNWPSSQDFNEAIQNPDSSMSDSSLQRGAPTLNSLGLPVPFSGNFADVYRFKGGDGKLWAVKCFTRAVTGLRERYAKIGEHLSRARLPFTVGFDYLDQGIRIRGKWFPLVKMEWVEGLTLNEFVRQNADKPVYLHALTQMWAKLTAKLRDSQIAHADLQHGNVLLVPGNSPTKLGLKLIDYDGMWVPPLANTNSGEVGHPNFQHPLRLKERLFNADVDRFPHLVIACALRATLVGGKAFWDEFDNGDNLLFREQDLRDPASARVFKAIWELGDNVLRVLAGQIALAGTQPLQQTPWLDEVLFQEAGPRLSSEQENRVVRLLGVAPPTAKEAVPAAAVAIEDGFNKFRIFDDVGDDARTNTERKLPPAPRQSNPGRSKMKVLLAAGAGGLVLALISVAVVLATRNGTVADNEVKDDAADRHEVAERAPKRKTPAVTKKNEDSKSKPDEKRFGASIDGVRWEFHCKFPMPANPRPGMDCASALVSGNPRTTDQFTFEKRFEGEKGKSYDVTLRFRGVVEPMMYKGGQPVGEFFYVGGVPDNPNHNIFKLSVSSPPSHYFLNREARVGPRTFMIDYTRTITIDGQAIVTFHGNGQDGALIANYGKLVVPGIHPAPRPFDGQFIQVNVVDVVEAKTTQETPSEIPKSEVKVQVKEEPKPFRFDENDPVWIALTEAKKTYRAQMDELHKKVIKYYDQREEKATKNGSQKELDQVKSERRDFERDYKSKGEISGPAPFEVKQKTPILRVEMENAFDLALKAYVKANKDKESDAVREELREFKRTNAVRIGEKK